MPQLVYLSHYSWASPPHKRDSDVYGRFNLQWGEYLITNIESQFIRSALHPQMSRTDSRSFSRVHKL
jgi:hypothetical protein